MLHDEHAERYGDSDSEGHGNEDEGEVIQRGAEDFGAVSEEKTPGIHLWAPSDGSRQAQNLRTSGWSRRRKSWGEPRATRRPASRRAMRWPSRSASRMSCVTKTMVLLRRRARALNSR